MADTNVPRATKDLEVALPQTLRWVENLGRATMSLEYRPKEGCAIVDMRGVVTARTLAHMHRRIVAYLEGYQVFGRVELLDRCALFLTEDDLDSLLPGNRDNFLSEAATLVLQEGMDFSDHKWTAANLGFIRKIYLKREKGIAWALDFASTWKWANRGGDK